MPGSVSSDNESKRKSSRQRSPEGPIAPSTDKIKKSSNNKDDHESHSYKESSRHGRRDERDRGHSRSSNQDPKPSEHRHRRRDEQPVDNEVKTRSRINVRESDSGNREVNRSRSRNRRGSSHERSSTITNVRIKDEPMSEDEDTRRREYRRGSTMTNDRTNPDRQRDHQRKVKDEPKDRVDGKGDKNKPKEKVNFKLSGKLAEDTNIHNGVVVKYNEPVEARKPGKRWRLYPFKGDEPLPMLPVHRQSAYLLGRERKVADIPIDHPSCSKQHAVLQYRAVQYQRTDGRLGRRIRPYIIDLESANGTFVNNVRIESKRYVELLERDVVKFGFSSREYVILHEGSATADDDIDESTEGGSHEAEALTEEI